MVAPSSSSLLNVFPRLSLRLIFYTEEATTASKPRIRDRSDKPSAYLFRSFIIFPLYERRRSRIPSINDDVKDALINGFLMVLSLQPNENVDQWDYAKFARKVWIQLEGKIQEILNLHCVVYLEEHSKNPRDSTARKLLICRIPSFRTSWYISWVSRVIKNFTTSSLQLVYSRPLLQKSKFLETFSTCHFSQQFELRTLWPVAILPPSIKTAL